MTSKPAIPMAASRKDIRSVQSGPVVDEAVLASPAAAMAGRAMVAIRRTMICFTISLQSW